MSELPSVERFDQLDLNPSVLSALSEIGYEVPTPIQAQCIPPLLEGRDVLGQAQTGTGKTAAFALPLLSRVDVADASPQVLVLAPTRELAIQVAEAFQSYAHHLKGFHVLPIYGGQNIGVQLRQLRRGPQVIVGTPGRVMDHMRRGSLDASTLKALVLDEADEMLRMGFIEDIDWIFSQVPDERQVALFSATMPHVIRKVAEQQLNDPVRVSIAARNMTASTVDQCFCKVYGNERLDALTRILEVEEFDAMIAFVRTRTATVELADKLQARGFSAEALNGDMNQQMRERVVEGLKNGRVDIVVATDVAARGLDVERISHVVNYDIPNDPEAYVHRIGRTGRAGRDGRAILFVQPREFRLLKSIERSTRKKIEPMQLPTAGQLSEHRQARFAEKLKETLTDQSLDDYRALVSRIQEEEGLDALDMAAALAWMGHQDRPLMVEEELREPRRERDRNDRGDRNRRDRDDRPRRDDRGPRRDRGGDRGGDDGEWVRYHLDVGRIHGATPREIVGAIANEADIDGRHIRRLSIQEDHSFVDLPEGMPEELRRHLQRVYVRGRALRLRPAMGGGERFRPGPHRDRDGQRPPKRKSRPSHH